MRGLIKHCEKEVIKKKKKEKETRKKTLTLDVLVVVIANRLLQVVKAFLGRTVISDRAVKRFYSLHRGKFKQCSALEKH